MKRIREAIDGLNYDELVSIQKDILTGSSKLKHMVSNKLREIEESESRICATCGSTINIKTAEHFTIIFGPSDFKKRASFCALDCMEYFLVGMKKITAKRTKAKI